MVTSLVTFMVPPLSVTLGAVPDAALLIVSDRIETVPVVNAGNRLLVAVDGMITLSLLVGAAPPVQPDQLVEVAHVVLVVPSQVQVPGVVITTAATGDVGTVSLVVATLKPTAG